MIYYIFDLMLNNLNYFTSATILININDYSKNKLLFILLVDALINKIPIIFFIIFLIKIINKLLTKVLTKSFVVDNIIYIINYVLFFFIIYIYLNNNINLKELGIFFYKNFFINYLFFLSFKSKSFILKL